jgi:8-oxo-dGTP diphosphatase
MMEKPFRLSAKALLYNDRDELLLIRRSLTSANNAGMWDLPGGKVDPGEDFATGLLREIVEETGLTAHLTRVAGHAEAETRDFRVVYIIMEAHVTEGEVQLSDEHSHMEWVSRQDLNNYEVVPQFAPVLTSIRS